MGRTKTFDRALVLAAAGNAFRRHGYRSVSIGELEKATGLTSGSIYNAFGDKAGLFRAALAHYVDGFVSERLERFAGPEARLENLEQLFLSVLEPPLADGYGCLVTNSIVEFGRDDDMSAAGTRKSLAMVPVAIHAVLSRELGEEAARADTTRLLVLYHGVLTLSRSALAMADMADAVRLEFDRLKERRGSVTADT